MKRAASAGAVRIMPGVMGQAWWLLCTAAAWYWALEFGGQAAWFVAMTTGTLMVYAALAQIGLSQRLSLTREVSRHEAHAGEAIQVTVSIRRQGPLFPFVWIIVRDELKGPDGKPAYDHRKMVFPGFRRRVEYGYEIPRLRRGIYTFGAATIEAAEPVGIVGRRWRLDGAGPRRLTVYPQPMAEAALEMPRHSGDSRAAAVAAMAMVEASPLVSTVREYAHGDPLQRIHWRSTARTGELKTKEPDALQQGRVAVVLDDAARAYGRGRMARARFETAASAACAVMNDAKRHGLAVELCCGTQVAAAEAEAPATAVRRALELLARAEPRGAAAAGDVLRQRAARLKPEVPLIVITPRLDGQLVDTLALLRKRRIAVTLLYIGQAATARVQPPGSGNGQAWSDPAVADGDLRSADRGALNNVQVSDESRTGVEASRVHGAADLMPAEEKRFLRQLEILGCRTRVIALQPDHELVPPGMHEEGRMPGGAIRYG